MQPQALLGKSKAISDLLVEAEFIAPTDSKVLISGESGVGKELIAKLIHNLSRRKHRPMVAMNCGAVPDSLLESELFGHVRGGFTDAHRDRRGLLEMADGGTVFLDEVGEMSLRMQTMLLRFLENGEIQRVGSDRFEARLDVRVISATNRDLLERANEKEFRHDLYYRLNVVHLVIPPLRARREDVRILLEHFLWQFAEQHESPQCALTPGAFARLEQYDWPGNIRELKNVAERLSVRFAGRLLDAADLPLEIAPPQQAAAPLSTTYSLELATACYERMARGESFWTAVYEPFMMRDLTRETLRAVVRMGLEQSHGSYRVVSRMFNLPPNDYKRFLAALQQHQCHLPFQGFRFGPANPAARTTFESAKIGAGEPYASSRQRPAS